MSILRACGATSSCGPRSGAGTSATRCPGTARASTTSSRSAARSRAGRSTATCSRCSPKAASSSASTSLLEPNVWLTAPLRADPHRRRQFLNLGVQVAAVELVEIGEHCMFANGCFVTDGNHRFDDPDKPVTWQGFTTKGPTTRRRQRLVRRERRDHQRRHDRRALRDRRQLGRHDRPAAALRSPPAHPPASLREITYGDASDSLKRSAKRSTLPALVSMICTPKISRANTRRRTRASAPRRRAAAAARRASARSAPCRAPRTRTQRRDRRRPRPARPRSPRRSGRVRRPRTHARSPPRPSAAGQPAREEHEQRRAAARATTIDRARRRRRRRCARRRR